MRKLGLALTILLATTALSQAAFLSGNLEVGGGSNVVDLPNSPSVTGGSIGFVPGSTVLPAINGTSGTFLSVVGDAVTFPGQGSPPTQIPFTQLTAAGNQPFVTVDGITFTLMAATESVTTLSPGVLGFDISGSGTFHLAGFSDTPGVFDLSTQSVAGAFQNTSFSASASAVPGPIVGAGLPGLLSLLGLGGLWWRKRKVA